MSFQLPSSSRTSRTRPAWAGMALMVEAMLLLFILIGSLAVITQLFAASSARAQDGRRLAEAVALATSEAERFAADPDGTPQDAGTGELSVRREVDAEPTGAGTLYHATISVFAADASGEEPLYVLETACYQQEVQ